MISEDFKEKISLEKVAEENPFVRPIEAKNLHITLIPPWYEQNLEDLVKEFKDIKLNKKPFKISFSSIELGPHRKRPRFIWIKGDFSAEMDNLKVELEKIFEAKGSRRKFTPHVTIARFPKNTLMENRKFKSRKIKWEEKINAIFLVESKLSREGAEYTVLTERRL